MSWSVRTSTISESVRPLTATASTMARWTTLQATRRYRDRPCDQQVRSKAKALDSVPLRHRRGEGRTRLAILRGASDCFRTNGRRLQHGYVPPDFPLKYLEVQGLGESTLGDDIRAVAAQADVQIQADKEPEHNRFIRSDQYSFVKMGVPALAFKFGWVSGSPEEKIFKSWYAERYHAPSDDLNQPVDPAAAAQFDAIMEKLALRVANADHRPEWRPESFFRRFAK